MKLILIFCVLLSLFSIPASSELTDADYEKLRSMLKEQTDELTQEIRASQARLKAHISQASAKTQASLGNALDRNFDALDRSAERLTRILTAYIIFLVALVVLACWVLLNTLQN